LGNPCCPSDHNPGRESQPVVRFSEPEVRAQGKKTFSASCKRARNSVCATKGKSDAGSSRVHKQGAETAKKSSVTRKEYQLVNFRGTQRLPLMAPPPGDRGQLGRKQGGTVRSGVGKEKGERKTGIIGGEEERG